MNDLKVLKLYQDRFPNVQAPATELINLSAILHLPKGTESFIADLKALIDAYRTGLLKESFK